MSIAIPCGYVPENSCEHCRRRPWEVRFGQRGDEHKLCEPCLRAIYTCFSSVSAVLQTEAELAETFARIDRRDPSEMLGLPTRS